MFRIATERFTSIVNLEEKTGFKKPDFFIVGAPKCGTTSMYYYLKQHPDVFMSVPKEPLYFCKDLTNHYLRTKSEDEYRTFFAEARGHKRIGEASTWYLYSKQAAREIKKFAPEARIIIMLRSIPEAMHSLHSQYLFLGNESVEDFEEALALEPLRRQGKKIPGGAYFPEGLLYSQVYRYYEQVKRYVDIFDREKILVLTLDQMKKDVEAVYRRVLDFLDLEEYSDLGFRRYNANGRFESELIQESIRRVSGRVKGSIRDMVPVKHFMKAWRKLESGLVKNFERPPLDENLRRRINEETREEIEKLSELLQHDFYSSLG